MIQREVCQDCYLKIQEASGSLQKGKQPEFTLIGGNEDEIIAKIERLTQPKGSRYHLGWDNVSEESGHIITVERTEKGLVFYDPQRNSYDIFEQIIRDMKKGTRLEILRVDRLLFNPLLLQSLIDSIS